jgi:hypothetical protein
MWKKGVWKKGTQIEIGQWRWVWHEQKFYIHLDSKDPVTGLHREITTSGDSPEWFGWKLQKEKTKRAKTRR